MAAAFVLLFGGMLAVTVAQSGCAKTTGSTAPPPPQVTVALLNKSLADADNTAVKAVIQLRAQGKVSADEQAAILGYCKVAALFSNQVTTIITSADPWATQRANLIAAGVSASLPPVASVSPTAAAVIAQVGVVFGQLKTLIGGLPQ